MNLSKTVRLSSNRWQRLIDLGKRGDWPAMPSELNEHGARCN